ncbi:hypothetical protein [Falsiroseomonas sp.]|uniref:hypothetical protein n=1 Tax=Falsiroseomonas sp. TaxID=2870721 RepID=UPI003F70DB82
MQRNQAALDRLVAELRRAAEDRQPCPSNQDLADALDLHEGTVADMLRAARIAGLVAMLPVGQNRRLAAACDGSWQTLPTRIGAGRAQAADKVGQRKCLRCKRAFKPESRYRFCCDLCAAINAREAA